MTHLDFLIVYISFNCNFFILQTAFEYCRDLTFAILKIYFIYLNAYLLFAQ